MVVVVGGPHQPTPEPAWDLSQLSNCLLAPLLHPTPPPPPGPQPPCPRPTPPPAWHLLRPHVATPSKHLSPALIQGHCIQAAPSLPALWWGEGAEREGGGARLWSRQDVISLDDFCDKTPNVRRHAAAGSLESTEEARWWIPWCTTSASSHSLLLHRTAHAVTSDGLTLQEAWRARSVHDLPMPSSVCV